MFARLSVVVPVPAWTKEPAPVMAFPLRSEAWVNALLRFTARVPLVIVILAVAPKSPAVPPLPSCKVPPLITVSAVNVLLPLVSASVPVPVLLNAPSPESAPLILASMASVPLLT